MKRQRGQSLVEFAIVVPVFLLLLLGLIDFSRLLFSYISITNGARELSRSLTITNTSTSTVIGAFNNLTLIGGTISPATTVMFSPPTGAGSGSVTCNSATTPLCLLTVATSSTGVTLSSQSGASGTASYTATNFNYSFNPTANPGDFVVLSWLAPDQNGLLQGLLEVCPLPLSTTCTFPSGLSRTAYTDGVLQVDVRYGFQFNPLFQNRLAGVVDVSFMRPSTLVTTTVRTYAE